jgi:hypothetical protein
LPFGPKNCMCFLRSVEELRLAGPVHHGICLGSPLKPLRPGG